MYEAFFGLSARPFADRPDPDFFVESELHAAALRALHDGLETQQPILIITGETGCGKTMLARALLDGIGETITVGLVTNPHTSVRDLTRWALLSFGQETVASTDAELREALALYLVSEYGAGRRCLLVVDEAQNLTPEALAGLHEYLDLNSEGDCVLQIVLVAGPRLLQTMRDPRLAPWAERVPQICLASPLALDETPRYVRSRLAVAGAEREIFTERALAAVSIASGGVPRLINAICDMALVYAFARGRNVIDHDVIADVVSQGRATGFGSLAMLAPVEADDEIGQPIAQISLETAPPPAEPAHMIEAPVEVENDIAPFIESQIVAETEPLVVQPEAAAAVAPTLSTGDGIRPEPAQAEFFPTEFALPEPAPEGPVTAKAEEPAAPALTSPPQIVHPHMVAAWPSIARNSKLSRVGHEDSFTPRSAAGGASLRRRFLPRD